MKIILSSFLSPQFTNALGWTLVHSLWQGTLIAVLMAVMLLFLNQRSAQVRYFVAVSALFLVLVAATITFTILYVAKEMPVNQALVPSVEMQPTAVIMPLSTIASEAETIRETPELADQWVGYFEQHTPLIVMAWMIGILVLTLRFMGGLLYINRLKQYKTQLVPDEWLEKTQALRKQIGFSRTVQLVESAVVKVPMAIGYFKPIILLPVGTFTGLSPQQVEAVLAHELAHIVRNDYWINIFQSFIEILFFFHPAVWWISGLVREEREHCCDDIAVQLSGDSLTFAQALTHLEVMQTVPALALSASGSRGSLLGRIQRILQQSPQKPTFTEGVLVSGVLVLCLLAVSASAFANLKPIREELSIAQQNIDEKRKHLPSDSVTDKTTYYSTFTDTAKVVREIIIVKDKKGNVTEVTVDGRRLSGKELKNYRQIIDRKLKNTDYDESDYLHDEENGLIPPLPPEPPMLVDEPEAPLPPKPVRPALPPLPPSLDSEDKLDAEIDRVEKQLEKVTQERIAIQEKKPYDKDRVLEIQAEHAELSVKLGELEKKKDTRYTALQAEAREQYEVSLELYRHQLRHYERELKHISHEKTRADAVNAFDEEQRIVEEAERINSSKHRVISKEHESANRNHELMLENHEKALREQEKAMAEHNKAMEKHNKMMNAIAKELKKDGLIRNEQSYSFQLTKNKLYINGKEQPENVFQKYKEVIKREAGEDLDTWKDTQKLHINHNWEQHNATDEASRKFIWSLDEAMGKAKPKAGDGC